MEMEGGLLSGSGTPPPIFSMITSALSSHCGWSQPLAWSVRPCDVKVQITFCCLSQLAGTTTRNRKRWRLG